ncbi:hypothetical protein DUZ99_10665 [Xylanibacillus composti]|uniref:Uncharacterized protein n=1 Tax=Xylanibacillus composti TaxID=1572762 RepID=A0A8J4H4Z0_9BACL|nr:hypothetical protein [Xylanibacillus composti]MDT9725432.1 hypothetical protein [Xylanibacillus composti]GIQ71053.1 hypothetical protein XYCOK13_38770 [Xylanibacillus composti]
MRMGTFLFGGLVGAAAAVYVLKGGRMPMLIGGMNQSGRGIENTAGAMMNMAKEGMQAMTGPTTQGKNQHRSGSADGLAQVQKFVEQDAEVKKAVNEIMKDNHINKPSEQTH